MFRSEFDAQRAVGPKCEEGTFEDSANWKHSPVRGFDFSTLSGSFAALQLKGGIFALISPSCFTQRSSGLWPVHVINSLSDFILCCCLSSAHIQHPRRSICLFFHLGLHSSSLLLIIPPKISGFFFYSDHAAFSYF